MGRSRSSECRDCTATSLIDMLQKVRRTQDLNGIMDTPGSQNLHTYSLPALVLTTNLSSCAHGGGRGPIIPRLGELQQYQHSIQTYICKVCSVSPILGTNRDSSS